MVGQGRRGQLGVLPGAVQPVLFLTTSLLAAPEPLGEVRCGIVVRPDYDGYCVYFVSYLALTRREAVGHTPGGGDGAVGEDPVASSGSPFPVRLLSSGRARAGRKRRGSRCMAFQHGPIVSNKSVAGCACDEHGRTDVWG
ncbi:hypothetical protein Taro_014424 [Colocasia esculenta]|uniref:Uncharacterized protein n=1 Tax=Colocasia esculenta TaxID=4460 RepID=A0A843UEV6_COLES|nr:hypothetical protein [Colocasia esculenta]